MIKNILLVGIGGFIGSLARYLTGVGIYKFADPAYFPFATMAVNLLGCFLIGVIGTLNISAVVNQNEIKLFAMVGILGGFTTFSAFGYETLILIKENRLLAAAANIILQVTLGLIAVWLGTIAAKQ